MAYGTVSFPTGQGMQGVNVVLQRRMGGYATPEPFYDASSVTGYLFQQEAGNPVTGTGAGVGASQGSTDGKWEGYYGVGWIPDIDPPGSFNGPMQAVVSMEAVNPLYVGAHAVGPYAMGSVEPSGSAPAVMTAYPLQPYLYAWGGVETDLAPANAASDCATAGDGTETAPLAVAAGGWWTDVLCAHGHAAWSSFSMQAGRTATIEVTALDESGLATTAKAMPLIGAWAATDATGTLPTLAATPSAFNTVSLGMTATGRRDGCGGGGAAAGDCGCARRWPAGLCLPGARALCGFDCARGGEREWRGDHDYRDGISCGQRGDGEWRGGGGRELEREQHRRRRADGERVCRAARGAGGHCGGGSFDGWVDGDDGRADV